MDITKLYCINKFPKDWEEEYEKRTHVLASLDSLDRLAGQRPDKIIMTRQQLAQYQRLIGSQGRLDFATIKNTRSSQLLYNGIPVQLKK